MLSVAVCTVHSWSCRKTAEFTTVLKCKNTSFDVVN